MIALGCAKNRVDAEVMLGILQNSGYTITPREEEADVIIINTCGFIDSAKQEAIDTIIEIGQLKGKGSLKKIIVTGCLAQRYGREIVSSLPEVDGIVGIGGFGNIEAAVEAVLNEEKTVATVNEKTKEIVKKTGQICYYDDVKRLSLEYLDRERVLTTPSSYAFLKIAEGCSNYCSYCAIPAIRGPFRSRRPETVLAEARKLALKGVSEIVVVAQDTTMYGTDINNGVSLLPELLRGLEDIEEIKYIRILYLYPDEMTEEIMDAIASGRKVVPYFDIPLQHISDDILKQMNRRGNGRLYRSVLEMFRKRMPDCVIRTSLITGFPGETEENHRELLEFLEEFKLDKVGVFEYSKEEGTPAAKLKNQIPAATKKRHRKELMEAQQRISFEKNQSRVGKVYDVVVDSVSEDGIFYVGRSYMEAPEEDGSIYFTAKDELSIGDVVRVKILVAEEYDLTGEQVD